MFFASILHFMERKMHEPQSEITWTKAIDYALILNEYFSSIYEYSQNTIYAFFQLMLFKAREKNAWGKNSLTIF